MKAIQFPVSKTSKNTYQNSFSAVTQDRGFHQVLQARLLEAPAAGEAVRTLATAKAVASRRYGTSFGIRA
ncbi:MAG: hypothetical protein IT572_09560 [Deltaproteobacteria bacterium]|nr:hypothetical protein [Deltaproteobacteria bacterium]